MLVAGVIVIIIGVIVSDDNGFIIIMVGIAALLAGIVATILFRVAKIRLN
jgi:hypothetical protein